MKKACAFDELACYFLIGPTDPVTKPGHFYCQLCQCDVSVLSHCSFEVLRNYQGAKHFAMDQLLDLEANGWRVLDFSGQFVPEEEVERQLAKTFCEA